MVPNPWPRSEAIQVNCGRYQYVMMKLCQGIQGSSKLTIYESYTRSMLGRSWGRSLENKYLESFGNDALTWTDRVWCRNKQLDTLIYQHSFFTYMHFFANMCNIHSETLALATYISPSHWASSIFDLFQVADNSIRSIQFSAFGLRYETISPILGQAHAHSSIVLMILYAGSTHGSRGIMVEAK